MQNDLEEHAKAKRGGCGFIPAALTGAAISGELTGSPIPIEPTIDGALYLAAEIVWPDGTYQWRNQADGYFE